MSRILLAYLALCAVIGAAYAYLPATGAGKGGPAAASATVTFQDTGAITDSGGGQTQFDYTGLTITAALTNPGLVAYLYSENASAFTSATWDQGGSNQAMTSMGSCTNNGLGALTEIFVLVNPVSGNKTLRAINSGAATHIYAAASSWSNVNTTLGTAFTGFTSNVANGASVSISVPSATNHKTTATGITQNVANSVTFSGTTITSFATRLASGANYDTGAATVTMTMTPDTSTNIGICGIDIAP